MDDDYLDTDDFFAVQFPKIDAVFDDPREDGLDIFAVQYPEINAEVRKPTALYVGWLSSRDFRFLDALVDSIRRKGIDFYYFHTGYLREKDAAMIDSELDRFVINMNKVSRSDQEENRSVKRLRHIVNYAMSNHVDLYCYAD